MALRSICSRSAARLSFTFRLLSAALVSSSSCGLALSFSSTDSIGSSCSANATEAGATSAISSGTSPADFLEETLAKRATGSFWECSACFTSATCSSKEEVCAGKGVFFTSTASSWLRKSASGEDQNQYVREDTSKTSTAAAACHRLHIGITFGVFGSSSSLDNLSQRPSGRGSE